MSSDIFRCVECGRPVAVTDPRQPCSCGCLAICQPADVQEAVLEKETLNGVHIDPSRNSKEKKRAKFVVGDSLHRKSGKWNVINRDLDRNTNRYKEVVTDPETGVIIHSCEEPLSEHQNHGSPKKKEEP